MKFKNGLDLCGFALTNFCIQGEASAPSDAALGRKYFHTNATDDVATGISLLNRERIYLGEGAWRATAYLDDIAAINEKLNLITGDTDTDTLINNLKDLEEFLKDFSETDKLKSLLDGKLSTSGGTIDGGDDDVPLKIKSNGGTTFIQFKTSDGKNRYIGVSNNDDFFFQYGGQNRTLIHSGNIGSQKVAGLVTQVTIWGRSFDGTADVTGDLSLPNNTNIRFRDSSNTADRIVLSLSSDDVLRLGEGTRPAGFNTEIFGYTTKFIIGSKTTAMLINTSGNVTIGASDLAGTSAKLLVGGNAVIGGAVTADKKDTLLSLYSLTEAGIMLQSDGSGGDIAAIYEHKGAGNGLTFAESNRDFIWRTGTDAYKAGGTGTERMRLTNGGNLLIGATTDSGYKLDVHGIGYFNQYNASGNKSGASVVINKGGDWFGIGAASNVKHLALGYVNASGEWISEVMTFKGNNVHIKGNLIVDGEVSAGGAGAEEDTSGSGSAEGVSEVFTPTSTSMAFDHNLGEDVIVQVYEKSGNVWNMVMVDTEITSATRVTLRFGKTETTQHKVVIMGV